MAYALESLADLDAAVEHYLAAKQLDPLCTTTLYNVANAYHDLGQVVGPPPVTPIRPTLRLQHNRSAAPSWTRRRRTTAPSWPSSPATWTRTSTWASCCRWGTTTEVLCVGGGAEGGLFLLPGLLSLSLFALVKN
jgi:hypothetical protein